MKKITALFFCLLFLLSACSGGKTEFNESDVISYVGEGEMTVIRTLVSSNAFFVEDVFIADHLPVDEENTVEKPEGTFAPVISEKFKSYSDFEKMLRATYTKAAADKLLGENKYTDIDGKLYFNTEYTEPGDYSLDWSEAECEATVNAEGKYAITVTVKNPIGISKEMPLTAVDENGNLRLENIYY